MILRPGRSIAAVGPSGTGKSTFALSVARYHGAGVICTIPGTDEMESYGDLYDRAEQPVWHADGSVDLPLDSPYVIAPFDDADFAPSLGAKELKADAQERLVFFLRAVRQVIANDLAEGRPPRWPCLIQDTYSAISDLASNAMLSRMRTVDVPKAISPEGSTYYGGLATRLNDVARASRVLKGMGMDWVTTSHVKYTEVSEAVRQGKSSASEQIMPLISGNFRERFLPMFDLVLFSEIVDKRYQMRHRADFRKQAKSRYTLATTSEYVENDWPTIRALIRVDGKPLDEPG